MPAGIARKNLTQEVLERLKENIACGKWPPGFIIPSEPELGRMFQVSRNTVRGAVQELCAFGVLKKRQGFGTQVAESAVDNFIKMSLPFTLVSPREFVDILEFRRTIELESVRLACERHTAEDLGEISRCLENLEASRGDPRAFVLTDYRFHLLIAKASKNVIFYKAMQLLEDIILRHMKEAVSLTDIGLSFERHGRILQAVRLKQGGKARQLMAEHFDVLIGAADTRNVPRETA